MTKKDSHPTVRGIFIHLFKINTMKKHFFMHTPIAIFLAGFAFFGQAQTSASFQTGVIFSTYKWKSNSDLKPVALPGFYLGATMEHEFNKTFSWAWGLELTQNQGESSYTERDGQGNSATDFTFKVKLQVTNVEVPLLLRVNIRSGKFKINLDAGISAGMATDGTLTASFEEKSVSTGQVTTSNKEDYDLQFFPKSEYDSDELESDKIAFSSVTFDGRVALGLSYSVGKGSLYVNGAYLPGAFDLDPDPIGAVNKGEIFSTRVLLSAGFVLPLE